MKLNLSKPICFFDLETTGVNISKDRIVEISILKVFPSGKEEVHTWLVNPEINIPDEVVAIHGISNEKVQDSPTFKDLAKEIHLWTSYETGNKHILWMLIKLNRRAYLLNLTISKNHNFVC